MHLNDSSDTSFGTKEGDLSLFASGVIWVAERQVASRIRAVRASVFSSVSLDPPIVLWAVPTTSLQATQLQVDHACGVSALDAEQAQVAIQGASGVGICWEYGEIFGAPLVKGAVASFEAVILRKMLHNEEMLFFGQLAGFCHSPTKESAVLHSGLMQRAETIY